MGFRVTDETKDTIGEQLFQLVQKVLSTRGTPLQEGHWSELGALHRGDYAPFLDEIVVAVEGQGQGQATAEPVQEPQAAPAPTETVVVPTEPPAAPVPITAADSSVLANTDLGSGVEVSKMPPPREAPEPTNPLQCQECLAEGITKICKSRRGLTMHRQGSHAYEPVPA